MNGKLDISMNDYWDLFNNAIYEASCLMDGDFTLEDFD